MFHINTKNDKTMSLIIFCMFFCGWNQREVNQFIGIKQKYNNFYRVRLFLIKRKINPTVKNLIILPIHAIYHPGVWIHLFF